MIIRLGLSLFLFLVCANSYSLELTCKSEGFPATLRIILNKTTLEGSGQAALVILPDEAKGDTPVSYAADIGKTPDRINEFIFTSGKPIDWKNSKETKCWVRNGINTTMHIKEFKDGKLAGSFFADPRIDIDPRSKDCAVPEAAKTELFSSRTISCEIAK